MLQTRNCYVYLIGWSVFNKWYYGRRTADKCDPKELWISYFTSSKYVEEFRKLNGEPDIIKIVKEFGNDIKLCIEYEEFLLKENKAALNECFINKTNGDKKFDTTGISSVMKGRKRLDITGKNNPAKRKESREKISNFFKGKKKNYPQWAKGTKGLIKAWNKGLTVDDPRILSGKNHPSKKLENKLKIAKGNTGKIFSLERKQNISKSKRDKNLYIFRHDKYGKIICSRYVFQQIYNISKTGLYIIMKNTIKTHKGWSFIAKIS